METKKRYGWLIEGIAAALIFSVVFISLYDMFQQRAKTRATNPVESESNIYWLYSFNQLLYRDLYNRKNNTQIDYSSLYYSLTEELQSFDVDEYEQLAEQGEETAQQSKINAAHYAVTEGLEYVKNYFESLENDFSDLNTVYDWMIRDTQTDEIITNTGEASLLPQDYYFYLSFLYDANGNVTVSNSEGEDSERIRKLATEFSRPGTSLPSDSVFTNSRYGGTEYAKEINQYTVRNFPVNCEVTYAMKQSVWDNLKNGFHYGDVISYRYGSIWYDNYDGFVYAGCGQYYIIFLILVFLLALFFPLPGKAMPWKDFKYLNLPLELLFLIAIILMSLGGSVVTIAVQVATGETAANMVHIFGTGGAARFAVYLANLIYLSLLFAGAWYVGINVRQCRETGIWAYIKKRSIIYRFFPFIKSKCLGFYRELTHIDVTKNARKIIIKIVIVNAVVLFCISTMWVAGFAVTVVYSLLLYFVLKKYISNLQKKYAVLLDATNEIAQGNLNVVIREDLGVFEPFRPQIYQIQQGFKKAVEEEVKSQRMKAELITNVSHDLKTPLTAIITYIGLLKDETISEEQRKEYLDTLERKSLRLKVLIEDLFDISKATSKTVQLNIMNVDILNLVKQAQLELSEKLEAADLEVRMLLPEEKIILPLDSQKTFRIYENLFGNIAKYALPGTRVYVSAAQTDDCVTIILKNISAQEIQVNPEELTDRFVRGDASRNTEGSGLGLAIAKSFTELQNGKLTLEVDGDLFKVITTWRKPRPELAEV